MKNISAPHKGVGLWQLWQWRKNVVKFFVSLNLHIYFFIYLFLLLYIFVHAVRVYALVLFNFCLTWCLSCYSLFDWLIGFFDWLIDWLVGRSVGRPVDRSIDWFDLQCNGTFTLTDKHTHINKSILSIHTESVYPMVAGFLYLSFAKHWISHLWHV